MRLYGLLFLLCCCHFAYGQDQYNMGIEEAYKKGIFALNNFQYQKALDYFYECHRVKTKNKEYLQRLAFCYLKLGDYTEAKYSYHSLLKNDSTNVNAWSNLGSIYEKELNFGKAKECYQELLTIDSTNSYYYRQNGFMALKTKDYIPAIFHFLKAHDLNERDLVVIQQLSSIFLKLDQPKEANTMIEKGLHLAPNNLKLLYTKADIAHQLKENETVIATLEKAFAQRDTAIFYQKMLGAAYLKAEALDSCIFHLNQVVAKKSDSEHTHYQLALAYQGKDSLEKSVEEYELAIDKAISKNTGLYYKNLALVLDKNKQLKLAIAAWKKAIEYAPEQPLFYFYLAKDCEKYYKDKKIARRYYQKYFDSKHPQYNEYVRQQIMYLNGVIHQQAGS